MRIIVCIKQVPALQEGRLDENGSLIRQDIPAVLNPYDRQALELALQLRDRCGGSVTVLTMGPDQAEIALREALAMSADEALLLSDPRFRGADAIVTAHTLAQAIRTLPACDLVLCGRQSTDGSTGQVGGALAALLELPYGPGVTAVDPAQGRTAAVTLRYDTVSVQAVYPLPCLLAVEGGIFCPRLPSLRAKLRSASAPVLRLTLEDLPDRDPAHYGRAGSATRVIRTYRPATPSRSPLVCGADFQPQTLLALLTGKEVPHAP